MVYPNPNLWDVIFGYYNKENLPCCVDLACIRYKRAY